MKKVIFSLAACCIVAAVNAQNKFYVLPSVGAGISNIHQTFYSPVVQESDIKNDVVFNYNTQLLLGYQWKHFVIETGAQYLTTGNSNEFAFVTVEPPQPEFLYRKVTYKYTSITIPVQIGYEIPVSPAFSVTPTIGANIGFNLSQQYSWKDLNDHESTEKLPNDLYGNNFKKTSIWGNAGVRLSYKINERIAIVGGPGFQYMLNNFVEDPVISSTFKSTQRNYSLDFNLGVRVNLL